MGLKKKQFNYTMDKLYLCFQLMVEESTPLRFKYVAKVTEFLIH